MCRLSFAIRLLVVTVPAQAKVVTQNIDYSANGITLKGYFGV